MARIARLHHNRSNYLFDSRSETFKSIVQSSRGYLEYGIGKSTFWAFKNSSAKIYGVESDQGWIHSVKEKCGQDQRLHLKLIDLGPLGAWGYPLTLKNRHHFKDYAFSFWKEIDPNSIDLVLIDGRFRISCFYMTLAHARPGCTIVFDDYLPRPMYSVVEEDLQPMKIEGRQAIFSVPLFSEDQRAELLKKALEYQLVLD